MSKARESVTTLRLTLKPDAARRFLIGAVVVILGLHVVTGSLHLVVDADWSDTIYTTFGVNDEMNVPTFFSVTLWLAAATSCWLLSRASLPARRDSRAWLAMAVISAFLAYDESARVHERLSEPVRDLTGAGGHLFFAWVIPYTLIGLVIVVVLGRFVWRLGRPVNLLILLGGFLYVSGAVGVELAGSDIVATGEEEGGNPTYIALYTVEEALEMLGVALFVYALLRQLERLLEKPVDVSVPRPRDRGGTVHTSRID